MSPALVTLFGNDNNEPQMYYNKDTGEMGFAVTAAAVGKGLSKVFGLIGAGVRARRARKKKAAEAKQAQNIAIQNATANQAAQLEKLKKQKIIKIVAISGGLLVVTLTALYFLKR